MKIKVSELTNLIYMLVFIFTTDSFLTFSNINPLPKNIFRIIWYVLTFWMFIKYRKKLFTYKKAAYILLIGIAAILFSMIVNSDFSGANITKILAFVFGFLFVHRFSFDEFKKLFSDWMIVIAGFSIVVYLLRGILINIPIFPRISNGEQVLVCLGLSNLFTADISGIVRNWGPFWEPGAYQAYLIVALLFVWNDKKRNRNHKYILLMALITTFSTTGYICFALLLLSILLEKQSEKTSNLGQKITIIMIGIFLLIIITSNDVLREVVFGKFSSTSSSFESTRSRLESINGNIFALCHNPIFGIGIIDLGYYFTQYMHSMGIVVFSNTNGLLMNFAIYGFIWGVIYVYMIWAFAKKLVNRWMAKIVIFAIFIALLFAEPFLQSLLFNTLFFYGLTEKIREETCEINESIVVNKYNASSCF